MRMADLDSRANIHHQTAGGHEVIVYEDHRYLLNIIDHARRCEVLTTPVTLVMFDYHDDMVSPPRLVTPAQLANMRPNLGTMRQRDFWSFVEWECSTADDDWVTVGMELGFIGNVIVIGARHRPNIEHLSNHREYGIYNDASGDSHLVASVGHIWSGLGHQGWLSDWARSSDLKPIWDVLGWKPFEFTGDEPLPILVDFDLDCFTYEGPADRPVRPWSAADFIEPFEEEVSLSGWTAKSFVSELMGESPFIGIARESPFCGGLGASDAVLRNLDLLFFNGELRPSTHGR